MNALELRGKFGSLLGQVWEKARTKTAPTGRRAAVRIVGRAALTATHSIHVVEVDGKRLVLGCHAGGILVLTGNASDEEGG